MEPTGSIHKESEQQDFELINVDDVSESLGGADFDIDKERFNLAANILNGFFWLVIFLIVIAIVPDGFLNQRVESIFNAVFQSVVPIASLIIGYYFGSKSDRE